MKKRDGTLKRVAINKGTTIQLCIVPNSLEPTLKNWDAGQHRDLGRGTVFIRTGVDGSGLSLYSDYLNDYPDSDIPVYNGSRKVGVMKFVADE